MIVPDCGAGSPAGRRWRRLVDSRVLEPAPDNARTAAETVLALKLQRMREAAHLYFRDHVSVGSTTESGMVSGDACNRDERSCSPSSL